jgi:hypothetical protein
VSTDFTLGLLRLAFQPYFFFAQPDLFLASHRSRFLAFNIIITKRLITSNEQAGYRGYNAVLVPSSFSYSYTGEPSDLNRLILLPSFPEAPEGCDSGSTDPFFGSPRLRAALDPKRTAVRKTKIPAVT